jgi:predicted nucleic acid-binding protein
VAGVLHQPTNYCRKAGLPGKGTCTAEQPPEGALVVDASVALKWILAELERHLAQALAKSQEGLLVTDFLLHEATNVCWLQFRKGQWTLDEARPGLDLPRIQVPPTPTGDFDLHEIALENGLATDLSPEVPAV